MVIDTDFNVPTTGENSFPDAGHMKAIIALKDENGNGGNVYITENVKKIYAYIVAEGSVFSGYKTATDTVSYIENGPFAAPTRQLYVNGLIVSKNTIGGNVQTTLVSCPVLTPSCNAGNAKNYDMSYFRNYDPNDVDPHGNPT